WIITMNPTFTGELTGTSAVNNWNYQIQQPSACWGFRQSERNHEAQGIYIRADDGSVALEIRAPANLRYGVYQNIEAYFKVPDTETQGPVKGPLRIDSILFSRIYFTYHGVDSSGFSNYDAKVDVGVATKDATRCPTVFI
ncbi:MAG: hypothetical protein ACREJQ_01665, partial [bacterium]